MPNIDTLFPSRWLKASDLQGREPAVTIKEVKYEPVGQAKEMKAVVYFQNVRKGLVLNKTNANRITQIAGSGITEEWVGVQIKLFSTSVEYQGEPTEAIRIRPVNPARQNPLRPAEAFAPHPPPARPVPPPAARDDLFEGQAPDSEPLTDEDIPF